MNFMYTFNFLCMQFFLDKIVFFLIFLNFKSCNITKILHNKGRILIFCNVLNKLLVKNNTWLFFFFCVHFYMISKTHA